MKTAIILTLSLFLLNGCQSSEGLTGKNQTVVVELPGPEEEIYYHLFQRSFYDSNGDQHGDFNGLVSKLDYLQELGVTSILMTPIYKSIYYHNYFADDFEEIDPLFGSKEDYIRMLEEIHRRGMKFYMDMEVHYVTGAHPWYLDSYGNPESEYTDYMLYNGEGNTDPESIIFDIKGLESYNGEYLDITTINLASSKVKQYLSDLFRYWVDPNGDGDFSDGVDGYRIDHMMDDMDWKGILTGLHADLWAPIFEEIRYMNPKLRIMGEQADWGDTGADYFETAGVDMLFAFKIREAMIERRKSAIDSAVAGVFKVTPTINGQLLFLENHDTERLSTKVEGENYRRAAAAYTYLLPGTPLIYYGQEIGMRGKGGHGAYGNTDGNDIPRREAFEWYASVNGPGMTFWYKDSGPWWDDTEIKANDGISVEEQKEDSSSLWNHYRYIFELRQSSVAFQQGSYEAVDLGKEIAAYKRSSDETFLVMMNLNEESQSFDWPMDWAGAIELIAGDLQVSDPPVLGAHGWAVVQLSD